MNLLIVDDEIIAIQGIVDGLDWETLKFDKVLTACSYTQAMNILLNDSVDVLLCDVEMPNGSGLDLVEWVQKKYPEVIKIFLSCHDEFDYARQAVRLECMEYILKPATTEILMDVLGRAIEKRNDNQRKRRYQEFGRVYIQSIQNGQMVGDIKDPVAKVEAYINENLTRQISVEELAKLVYISPDHLTRMFRKKYGKTIVNYIIDQRMILAKELIREGKMSMNTVSAAVGYMDYSYFNRLFKKKFGITPKEYQQSVDDLPSADHGWFR